VTRPIRAAIRAMAAAVAVVALAACGASNPSPAPSATPLAAIASPTASTTPGPSASASASLAPPTPAPTPLPAVPMTASARAALAKYVALSTAPARSFHASLNGTTTIDGADAGIYTDDLEVAGKDVSSTATVLGNTIRLVAIGDRMWVKSGEGDWVAAPRNDQAVSDILDVFGYVGDPKALVYIGSTVEGGHRVEHFRSGAPIPYQTGSMRAAGIFGSITDLGLTIEADGTPVRITYRSAGDIPNASGVVQHVESSNLMQLSQWGDAITISPPV
jgi:predicted small lipoprotein YifL